MNKKVLMLIFIFLIVNIIYPLSTLATTNEFSNLTIDVSIDENGTASVTEVWEVSIYDGTEMYKSYYDLETSEIQNLSVKEGDTEYELLSTWDISATQDDKKEKCGINTVTDGVELCWGIGDYGTHTYTISYEITNFVTDYGDYQMTYFTLVPTNMDPAPEQATITVGTTFEFTSSNVTVSSSGFTGDATITDGNVVFETTSAMTSSQYMTVQIKYESDAFNTTDIVYDTEYLEDADEDEEDEEEETSSWVDYFPYILIVIAIIIVIAFVVTRRKNNNNNTTQL